MHEIKSHHDLVLVVDKRRVTLVHVGERGMRPLVRIPGNADFTKPAVERTLQAVMRAGRPRRMLLWVRRGADYEQVTSPCVDATEAIARRMRVPLMWLPDLDRLRQMVEPSATGSALGRLIRKRITSV